MSNIERLLLARLTDPAEVKTAWDAGVRPQVFEEPLCEAVYDFTVKYWYESGREAAPTKLVLEHEFPGLGLPDTSEETTDWLANTLKKHYVTNQLKRMLTDAAEHAFDDPHATLRKLYSAAYEAAEAVAPRLTRMDMATNIEERRRWYEDRESRPEGVGLPFGIPELDVHTGGTMPGELVVVGAFSKTGKTFFLANTAVALHKAGYTPLVFTLEMSLREVAERIDALYSGASYNRLVHGKFTDPERAVWRSSQENLAQGGSLYVERPDEGERTPVELINRAREVGADYVLIDQLSTMDAPHSVRNLKEHSASIMRALKIEIGRTGREIPCMLAVQQNRDSVEAGTQLKNFANATEIEAWCDIAIGLERSAEERLNHLMRLQILGGRRAEAKSWLCRWELSSASQIDVVRAL